MLNRDQDNIMGFPCAMFTIKGMLKPKLFP